MWVGEEGRKRQEPGVWMEIEVLEQHEGLCIDP